jgi:hypothetical protein
MIDGYDSKVLTETFIDPEPVQVCSCGPTMKKKYNRGLSGWAR